MSPPLPCCSSLLSILHVSPTEDLPLTLDPDPIISEDDPYLSPPESSDSRYFLRYSANKAMGGLGKGRHQGKEGRGRKSFLDKAHSKAKKDLQEGKQLSIERALRVV